MKTCPMCGDTNVTMFDADNDICKTCGKWFPAVANIAVEVDELTTLRAEVSALQTEVDSLKGDLAATEEHWKETDDRCGKLQIEAKHWRDQHANEVRRAKILKDRTDLPLERVRAYELMGELRGQVERLTAQLQLAAAVNEGRGENDKKLNKVTDALIEQLRAEVFTSYEKGAESMRERAAKVAERRANAITPGLADYDLRRNELFAIVPTIRALPLKENEG